MLYKLLYLCKYSSGFLFISKRLHNSNIIKELFEDAMNNALVYLKANFLEDLP